MISAKDGLRIETGDEDFGAERIGDGAGRGADREVGAADDDHPASGSRRSARPRSPSSFASSLMSPRHPRLLPRLLRPANRGQGLHGDAGRRHVVIGHEEIRHQRHGRIDAIAFEVAHAAGIEQLVVDDVTDEREHAQTLRDIERRRQSLLEEIINAESEQRSRIAGELHDDTIQVMIASLFELDRSERHLRNGDVEAARGAIAKARATLAEATERTRRLTFDLRPQLLEAAGLGPAIRDLADALHRDTGAEVTVRTRLGRYPVDIETLAYRTIREALINVRRHARAGNVAIGVSERRGALHATVGDDGRGFAGERRRTRTSKSMGIATARERIRAHGGSFEVTSTPGEGTTVEFSLPLPSG